jgi:hypothetical protein
MSLCFRGEDPADLSSSVHRFESLRSRQRESEREVDELFNSLMQKVLRGELVLPSDGIDSK